MMTENIKLAINSLLSNKMRAILTMLGIIIGIASVIAIVTVGESLKLSVSSAMESFGVNNINVGLQQRSDEENADPRGVIFGVMRGTNKVDESDYYTPEMIDGLCRTYADEIKAVSAYVSVGSGSAFKGKTTESVNVLGISPGYFVANDLEVDYGNIFSVRDFEEATNVAIISDRLAESVSGGIQSALGSVIEVNIGDKYVSYTVVGIYKYEQQGFMYSPIARRQVTTNMYIPVKTAKGFTHVTGYQNFAVVISQGIDADQFAAKIQSYFEGYYRNNKDYEPIAFSMGSIVSEMMDMMSTVTLAISIVAGIALLVGGIGVMNIMFVSIVERTKEIGTRKALGATNGSIRTQFIVEAIIICLIGGIIGIVFGVTAGSAAAELLGYPAKASVSSIVISIMFSMAIGVFFGYYPANKAAKMNPIDALRYE